MGRLACAWHVVLGGRLACAGAGGWVRFAGACMKPRTTVCSSAFVSHLPRASLPLTRRSWPAWSTTAPRISCVGTWRRAARCDSSPLLTVSLTQLWLAVCVCKPPPRAQEPASVREAALSLRAARLAARRMGMGRSGPRQASQKVGGLLDLHPASSPTDGCSTCVLCAAALHPCPPLPCPPCRCCCAGGGDGVCHCPPLHRCDQGGPQRC